MRNLILPLALLVGGVQAMPGQPHQPRWEPLASGGSSDPARFKVVDHFPELNESGRRHVRPRLHLSPNGRALLVLQTTAPSTFTGKSGYLAFEQVANVGWKRQGTGRVWMDDGMALPRGYSTAAGRNRVSLAVPAVPPGDLTTNLFATFARKNQPWGSLGGTLSQGGISNSTTFTPSVQQSFTTIDSFDNPYIGWTYGGNSDTAIHAGRWFLNTWQGFGGPISNPVYQSPSGFRILSPSLTFTGGSPVLVFSEVSGTRDRVRAMRFRSTDASWIAMDDPVEGIGDGRHVRTINRGNEANFFVSFENLSTRQLKILEWTGSGFVPRPGAVEAWGFSTMAPMPSTVATIDASIAPNHDLAFDHRGRLAVAFRAVDFTAPGKYHIFVSILDHSTGEWSPIGNTDHNYGSNHGDYFITGPGSNGHRYPSLTFTLDNRPVLASELDTGGSGGQSIQIRRFSRGLGDGLPNRRQGAARLLGLFDRDTLFDSRMLEANSDTILDAADLIGLPK